MDKTNLRLLSNFIYKMQFETESKSFKKYVLDVITMIISCDRATFYFLSEVDGEIIFEDDPAMFNVSEYMHESYRNQYIENDYMLWVINNTNSTVFRETDCFEDSVRMNTEFYKKMYEEYDVHYVLQACLYYAGKIIGLITLFRNKNAEDFSDDDVFWLEILQGHIAQKTYEVKSGIRKRNERIRTESVGNLEVQAGDENEQKITAREQEIIDFILDGYTNEEIAEALCISVNTVKKHLANIYLKLGIKSRWELLKLK